MNQPWMKSYCYIPLDIPNYTRTNSNYIHTMVASLVLYNISSIPFSLLNTKKLKYLNVIYSIDKWKCVFNEKIPN